MGYKFSFADDTLYSAEDINNITKRLVSKGVADSFADGVAYNVTQLNNITKTLGNKGVVPEDNTTLKVVKTDDGNIKIMPGSAFMESGAVFTCDSDGYVFSETPTGDNYVYIEDNEALNAIRPVMSSSLPASYDYVLLALVSYDGKITDKRTYAKGKLPGYMSDFNMPVRKTLTVDGVGEYEIDVERSMINAVMIVESYNKFKDSDIDSVTIWNKYDNKYLCRTCYSNDFRVFDDNFYILPHYSGTEYMATASLEFSDGKLKINVANKSGITAAPRTRLEITVF